MYFLHVHVNGNCSLSKSTGNNESKIIVGSVYQVNGTNNSMLCYSIGSTIQELYSQDFTKIKFIKGDKINMFTGTKKGHGIMNAILDSGGIPMYPFIAHNGGESYSIIHPTMESLQKNLDLIEKNNIISSYDYNRITTGEGLMDITRKLNMDFNFINLTKTERSIIKEAFNLGYLNWPRSINLNGLAEEFDVSKPSILLHIRSAERKIIAAFLSK
ncbi:MAG: helix-turn-helix domain-containing protein [Ferroplasma sp.]